MQAFRMFLTVALLATISNSALAVDLRGSLKQGKPDLKSAGALSFGPDGILFVGDSQGGAVFAFDTGDRDDAKEVAAINVARLNQDLAGMLGVEADQVTVNDLAINPKSGKAYLSVSRGRGPDAEAVLVRVDGSGKLAALEIEELPFARSELASLPDAAASDDRGRSPRAQAITDLVFTDGRVLVAGLSNEEFSSRLLAIPFPFTSSGDSSSIEIYHGAHGRFETRSPVRTFLATELNGQPHILAAYTCTPLVKIPCVDLAAGNHVKGTTIAELGNQNQPLDMIAYRDGDRDFLLVANSKRGVMKVATDGAESAKGITSKIDDTAGLPYETIGELKGVVQLDKLDDGRAVIVEQSEGGDLSLRTIDLP